MIHHSEISQMHLSILDVYTLWEFISWSIDSNYAVDLSVCVCLGPIDLVFSRPITIFYDHHDLRFGFF